MGLSDGPFSGLHKTDFILLAGFNPREQAILEIAGGVVHFYSERLIERIHRTHGR